MKIIDAHLHVAELVAGYCRRGELRAVGEGRAMWGNGEVFELFPKEYGDRNFTVEAALGIMEKHGISKAVLMQGSMYGFQNQYHRAILERDPERFCPSCTVDPYMANALETLEYDYETLNFRLTKFEISSGGGLMGCHDPFSISSDRMMKLYEVVNRHKGILALDVGNCTMPSYQPEQLAEIARAFPRLKLVVCHLLAPAFGEEQRLWKDLEMLSLKNVWFDLAALPKIMTSSLYPFPEVHAVLARAKEIVGADKLMWGSDAPFAATQHPYGQLTDYLEKLPTFTEKELEGIYYNNAEQVYFSR